MVNYFELMQLPVQFAIDEQRLQERMRQLQRQFHPDNLTNNSDGHTPKATAQPLTNDLPMLANLTAEQRSAVINEAYRTLASPDSRAKHLLALQGIEQPITDSIRDLDFLEQAMDYRMSLDEATSLAAITSLKNDVQHWLHQYTEEFEQVYHTIANGVVSDKAITNEQIIHAQTTALQVLQKLQFLVKLSNDIDKKYDELANRSLNANDDDLYV